MCVCVQVQEAAAHSDQKLLLQRLCETDSALTQLLHTIFPGEFEEATPTCNGIGSPEEEEQTITLPMTSPPMTSPPIISPLPPSSPLSSCFEKVHLFLVIMDYDPHALCTTGSPEQELTLPTGQRS